VVVIIHYVTYVDIAEYFIAFSNTVNTSITNLKLQKLVYYAQAWHLALFNRPLFQGNFQAWTHGPVLPTLYYRYKEFSGRPIELPELDEEHLDQLEQKFGTDLTDFLEEIISKYYGFTAVQLESLSHSEQPWVSARNGLIDKSVSNNIINNKDILNFYKNQIDSFCCH
jgi:uncharacterized phage-associated protein